MHLRKLVLACGFASLALSNYASALGLGEIKLKSTLNQPLSAEVQLLDTRDLTAEQIIIALASPADFERNGVDRSYFYTQFQFDVQLNHAGGPVVNITSRDPVREPYLNFLLEARWSSGRLLREYTVLMDLPAFDDTAPKAVQAPATTKPKATTSATNKPAAEPAVSSPAATNTTPEEKPAIIAEQDESAKKSKVASGTYGPIGDKDTLWDIALAVRPDSSVSVHQTMLALQRLNPDAFIRGNINLIKKGQVLRVPDAAEIATVSKSEAATLVNSQNSNWTGNTASTGLGAQLDATKHTTSTTRQADTGSGRVKLEAPSSGSKTANGQGSGANKGSGRALESELASTLEELDKAKAEKTELSSRVHDLEEQVKTMQRLVDVSNEKLRAMQLTAAKQAGDTKTAASEKSAAKSSEAKVATESSAASVAPAVVPEAASSQAAASSAPAKKPVKKPVAPPPPAEKSLVDLLLDNILYVGAGALALVAVAGLLIARRRKAEAEANSGRSDLRDIEEENPDFSAFSETPAHDASQEAPIDEMALFDEEDTTAVAETGDVVGEADIYIAYGKFDQAEEMLLNALAKDPGSTDIRLKLLEIYSQTQNLPAFDKHYAAILPLATGFALSRAAELRSNIPGAGEFDGTGAAEAPTSVAEDEFNFDLDDETPVATSATTAEDDFDFDLDLDDEPASEPMAAAAPEPEFGLDLDLDEPVASSSTASQEDEFNFDFDDEPAALKPEAEDLSDISLALDSLDEDTLPEDIELASSEDEFSFDFNELDDDTPSAATKAEAPAEQNFNAEVSDDFNFDLDVNDMDLAALDADFDALDADDKFAALDAELGEEPGDTTELDLDSDFALDDDDKTDFDFDAFDKAPAPPAPNINFDEPLLEDESDVDASLAEESVAEAPVETEASPEDFALDDLDWEAEGDDELVLDEEEVAADDLLAADDLEEELVLDEDTELTVEDDFSLDDDLADTAPSFDELDAGFDEEKLSIEDEQLSIDDEDLSIEEDAPIAAHENEIESDFSLDDDLADTDLVIDEEISEKVAATEPTASVAEAAEDISEDDLFDQALSDFSVDDFNMDETSDLSDEDMDSELDFMADADEAATKLDLARAYMDMGDNDGARDILAEVASEGNDEQRKEAADLLSRIDA